MKNSKLLLTPKISVILPVFNAEKFLKESIESILGQTYTNFELLAINDGSTDNSKIILESFPDPRLRVIDNGGNFGLIYSLNNGIELAQGEFLARMDADDISDPERLAKQSQYLINNPNIALVGSCAQLIDENGNVFSNCKVPLNHNDILSNIFTRNCFIHPSVMFRLSVSQFVGGYDTGAKHAEDYDLWLRVIEKYQVANLPDDLIFYRIHPNQISQQKLYLQRKAADRVRIAAFDKFKAIKISIPLNPAPIQTSLLENMQGIYPSVGADCVNWIQTYRSMGRIDLAFKMIWPAFLYAPFCKALYHELYAILISVRTINKLIKSFSWYRKKIILFFISSKP